MAAAAAARPARWCLVDEHDVFCASLFVAVDGAKGDLKTGAAALGPAPVSEGAAGDVDALARRRGNEAEVFVVVEPDHLARDSTAAVVLPRLMHSQILSDFNCVHARARVPSGARFLFSCLVANGAYVERLRSDQPRARLELDTLPLVRHRRSRCHVSQLDSDGSASSVRRDEPVSIRAENLDGPSRHLPHLPNDFERRRQRDPRDRARSRCLHSTFGRRALRDRTPSLGCYAACV